MANLQAWYNSTNAPQRVLLYGSALLTFFLISILIEDGGVGAIGAAAHIVFLLYFQLSPKR
jgi:hypothetical protein